MISRDPLLVSAMEATLMSLKPNQASKKQGRQRCKARTKAGASCQAPAMERGLCFFHAHPEKLAELGRQGGKKNGHWKQADCDLLQIRLKSIGDVSGLLEETINRVRRGPFDLRAANAIGFLAGILIKALESGRIEDRLAHLEAAMTARTETEMFDFRPVKELKNREKPPTTTESN
jgi:hypothetical protein